MKPCKEEDAILCGYIDKETYYLGCLGLYAVVLVMCKPGSIQRDSMILTSQKTFHFWEVKVAILCGIAFGLNKKNQN